MDRSPALMAFAATLPFTIIQQDIRDADANPMPINECNNGACGAGCGSKDTK